MPDGKILLREIQEQFDVWKGIREDFELLESDVKTHFDVREFDEVLFVGAGSSFYLAESAAAEFRHSSGEQTTAISASELLFFCDYYLKKERKYIAVLFSRSGETSELLSALDVLKKKFRVITIAITCTPASTLMKQCDMGFPVKNCVEENIIMTKSFTGMLFMSYMFSLAFSEKYSNLHYIDRLADEGRAAFEMQRRVMDSALSDVLNDRVTLIGGGPMLGIARECALKLDEVALLRTKCCSTLELRHGPHAAVGEGDLVISLMSDSAREAELFTLREMKSRGAAVIAMADRREQVFEQFADHVVLAGRSIPEAFRGILYAPLLQYLSAAAALKRGLDPDEPAGLTRIVKF